MRRSNLTGWELVWIVLPVVTGCMVAEELLAAGQTRTAPPPKFDQAVIDVFAPDARKIVGEGEPGPMLVTPMTVAVPMGPGGAPSGGGIWTALISGESIESEIKFQQSILSESAKTINGFKSGGNVKARDSLLMMASLFAIMNKYEGEVKWKKDSEGMQQACTQAGNNCKTSSDNAYKEVTKVVDMLKALMQGQVSDLPKLDPESTWGQHITINPLMKRLELAEKDHLGPWTSDAGALSKNKDAVIREGEALAFIGQFINDPSFDLVENADYKGWANDLVKAGKDLAQAAKDGDHAKALAASAAIKKTCADCHGAYR
ncbi:MAG: cytochrome c [Planctomycetaceae bacterium]|nr:cytochrome c [Planctomycetaceae bacterium]